VARILVIDDDEFVRRPLRKILEAAGYTVEEAPEGNAGLAIQRTRPCDLVITDLFMPGKEGLATIRELRREFPAIKIIAISGGVDLGMNMLPHAEVMGALRTLPKPFERAGLLALVEELLTADPPPPEGAA